MCGVRKRGWTVPKTCGNSPSRDMAMKIRAWLRKSTSSTLVMPARPPAAMRPPRSWAEGCPGPPPAGQKPRRWGPGVDLRIGDHARHHGRHDDVQQGANPERDEDADRHVALRAAGLLGVGRDGIEADEGEENDRRSQHDAREAVGHERAARGVVDGHQPAIQPQQCPTCPTTSASAACCLLSTWARISATACRCSAVCGRSAESRRFVARSSLRLGHVAESLPSC